MTKRRTKKPKPVSTKPKTGLVKLASEELHSQHTQVNTIDVLYDVDGGKEITRGVFRGRYFLLIGDADGYVTCIDFSQVLKSLQLQPIDPDNLPVNQHNYFARRRFSRDYSTRLHEHPPLPGTMYDSSKIFKVDVVARWRAHIDGSVNGLACIENPKSVLTFSTGGGTLGVWRLGRASVMCGQRYGIIDCRSLNPHRNWTFPADKKKRYAEKLDMATSLLRKLESDSRNYGGVLADANKKETTDYHALMDEVKTSYGYIDKKGRHTTQEMVKASRATEDALARNKIQRKLKKLRFLGRERSRAVGQMYGLTTWKTTTLEKSWESALKKEIEDQKIKTAAENSRRRQALARATKETRELADYSALLTPPEEELSATTLRQTVPTPWLPAGDKANWGINSINRQKQMYVNMFHQQHKANEQSRRRKKVSLDAAIKFVPSTFLENQLKKLQDIKKMRRQQQRKKKRTPDIRPQVQEKPETKKEEPAPVLTEEERIAKALAEMNEKFAAADAAKKAEIEAVKQTSVETEKA